MKKNLLFTVLALMFATLFSSYGQYTGTGTFTKITTVDQIESDAYYVLFGVNGSDKGVMSNTLASGRFKTTDLEPDGSDQFVNPDVSIVWKFVKNGDGNITIFNEDASKFCEIFKSSTSGFALEANSTQQFVPSANGGVFTLKSNGGSSGGRCISIYKSDWRPYSESSAKDLYLYKFKPVADNDAPIATFNLTEWQANVADTQQLVVTFSEAVRKADGTELTNANIADIITLTEIPPVASQTEKTDLIISISDDKTVVTIDTKTVLKTNPTPGYSYKLTVSGVEDLAGNDIAADAVLNFRTKSAQSDPSEDNFFWSGDYEIDHAAKTIKGIPFGVTKADFLSKLNFRGTPGKLIIAGDAFVTDDNAVLVNANRLALANLIPPAPNMLFPGTPIYTLEIPAPISIKSIQETTNASGASPKLGEKVWIQGVVTAIEKNSDDSQKAFFVQDAAAAWSGIYIKDTKAVAVGNKVSIKGTVGAYKNMTHIETITENTVIEANATPFAPVEITIQDANKEDYESVLVKMTGKAKTKIASKKWTITDGTNDLFVYGKMYYPATVTVNDTYIVTGIHGQYNSDYQLYPRAEADYVVKSSANDVATFVIQHNEGDAVIDNITRTIKAKVVHGTNVTALTAAYTLSKNATIAPDPANATDYTNPVEFTVTAENGDDVKWTVTVEVAPAVSIENDIKTFTITNIKGDAVIDAYAKTVKAKVTNGTAVDNLTATITVSAKATITPDPATVTDYTNPVVFKVTAESGDAQDWTVKVTEAPAPPSGTLFISEISDPKDKYEGRFVELYNGGADIDFDAEDYYLVKLTNGNNAKVTELKLTGKLGSYETYIVSYRAQDKFETFYPGRTTNLVGDVVNGNGDDPYILVKGGKFGTGNIIDLYGTYEDGTGKPWEYLDGKAVRKSTIKTGNVAWVADEWTITRPANVADMTPEVHTVDGIQDLNAPKVSFDIAEGAENIVLDTDIKIYFNEAILNEDGTEVTDANVASLIYLKQSDNGNDIAFTATINAEKTEITVNPDADLAPYTNYKLRMGSVEDAAGNESDAVILNFKSKVAETAEALIKTFSIPNMLGDAAIDAENKVVKVLVFEGTDITNVDATVTMSTGATVAPAFTGVNYTSPVQFVVTSQDNHPETGAQVKNTWTITVEIENVLTIKEIQEVAVGGDESTLKGQTVSTKGIVTSLVNNKDGNLQGYMIQDAAEAWGGIYVHDNTHADVKVGDQLHIRGKVDEFFKATQVRDLVYYKVLAQSQTVYSPIELTTAEASQEKYESVLVKVTGECTVAPNNYKEWKIEDTSGVELVINSKSYTPDHKKGRQYQVIGYMTFAFNKFQVIVRKAVDVVDVTPPNTEANITAATVPSIVGDVAIDASAKTVKATVTNGTDVTNLAITYTLSYGATIAPDPATVKDYSSPVTFKVTAEDGKVKADWTVTIAVAPKKSTEAMITAAAVPNAVGNATIDASAKTVKAVVPKGTDLTNLAVTYTISDKATISPDPATVKDYSAPVKFTVTAEDGTTAVEWTVTITEDKGTDVDGESFEFTIYPNPVQQGGALFIDADEDLNGAMVEIFTAIGTHVETAILTDGTFNVSLRSGIYIIRVTIDNKIKTVRLIVE